MSVWRVAAPVTTTGAQPWWWHGLAWRVSVYDGSPSLCLNVAPRRWLVWTNFLGNFARAPVGNVSLGHGTGNVSDKRIVWSPRLRCGWQICPSAPG